MHTTDTATTAARPRALWRRAGWAATGAALTITGGITFASVGAGAIGSDQESAFVPMPPCRLFDTRPESNIGPRDTPLGSAEEYAQQVTGTNGDCTVPAGATAVSLNVTVVDPTAPSYLTLWPADAPVPNASNLNYFPGTAPTPNKVDVRLSADGRIKLMNRFGTAHVLADVGGYYTGDGLRELAAQSSALAGALAELKARVDALEAGGGSDLALAARVDALEQRVGGVEDSLDELDDLAGELTALVDRIGALEGLVDAIDVADLAATVAGLVDDLDALESLVGAIGTQLGDVDVVELADTVTSLLGQLGDLTTLVDGLEISLGGVSSDVLGLGVTTTALSDTVDGLGAEVTGLAGDLVGAVASLPFALTSRLDSVSTSGTAASVLSVQVTAPVDGTVTLLSTASGVPSLLNTLACSINDGALLDGNFLQELVAGLLGAIGVAPLVGSRTFPIGAGETVTYNLVCEGAGGLIKDGVLTAIFTPAAP